MDCGLTLTGVTDASDFDGLEKFLATQINAGFLAGLPWFGLDRARHSGNPSLLQDSAKSIISVGLPYWSNSFQKPDDGVARGRISRYAWGDDYHRILKGRMDLFVRRLQEQLGREVESRRLVDTARVSDRAIASRAGVGWYGKNSCLIVPGYGSGVFLGEIILDIELQPDRPLDADCGKCRICLDRCPTGAIVAPYQVDAGLCLSFQTIEQRGAIPVQLRAVMGDWVFGCDICQEVCPYNYAGGQEIEEVFQPKQVDRCYPLLAWLLKMTETEFRQVFRGSAVLRAKRVGMARNAAVALGNVGADRDLAVLGIALTKHDELLVRGHAAWAIGQIGGRQAVRLLENARHGEAEESVLAEIAMALASPARADS